ncbi:MAG TPA: dienelactone hydrolase family protein, partial [Trebonia sp.]
NGKTYEFHSYPNTGHSFFSVNRPSYRVEAANDGWEQIFAFYGKYLSARPTPPSAHGGSLRGPRYSQRSTVSGTAITGAPISAVPGLRGRLAGPT